MSVKKVYSKRDLEEQRKKDEEKAAAEAFEEYVAVFQQTSNSKASKVWIKAGTYDAGKRHEDTKEKGTLYKPTSRFEKDGGSSSGSSKSVPSEPYRPDRPGKKKEKDKKKSNLEIFKEELKIIQEEREERHRLKQKLGLQEVIKLPPKPGDELRASLSLELDDVKMGSIDDGDPNTTNIYLGNLPTKINEQYLMELFGKYGPLASVKVMWPRTDEEKARNRLSGFVAFMSRRDGERALKHLAGKEILGSEVKLGWGKAVPIPAYPIYIPPPMLELTMPPPLSGLPFNAQIEKKKGEPQVKLPPPGTPYPTEGKAKEEFEKILLTALVKVVVPTDRTLLALIHRMVEFVTREGPMFEAMIMNKEISNPQFRFLFENQSPAHVYYRWKLFSILQGDSTSRWRTDEFRMFKNGSIWRPPTLNPFTQGMPDELIPEEEREIRKGTLSNAQRIRLERMLRYVTPQRHKIAEVMIFCIEHAESADEICQCLKESLSNPKTALTKKIARLYVISDVLYNSTAKGMNASCYKKQFKPHLPGIFQEIHYGYQTACGTDRAEGGQGAAECFKERVMGVFRAWDDWGVFSGDFLIRLQNIFLGLLSANSREEEEKIFEGLEPEDDEIVKKRRSPPRATMPPQSALNFVRSLQSDHSIKTSEAEDINEDIDGVPLECYPENSGSNNPPALLSEPKKGSFIPSKWETVDPDEVKAQAVTSLSSKWEAVDEEGEVQSKKGSGLVDYEEDIDGVPMEEGDFEENRQADEDRRNKLREIELKVLAFQDEIESGRRTLKGSVQEMVESYRNKLLRKADREMINRTDDIFEDDEYDDRKKRSRDRDSERRRNGSPAYDRAKSPSSYRSYGKSSKNRRSRSDSKSPSSHRRSHHLKRSRSRSPSSKKSRMRSRSRTRSRSKSPSSRKGHKHSKSNKR